MLIYFKQVVILGIVLRDPGSVVTNLTILLVTLWCLKKFRSAKNLSPSGRSWRYLFLLICIASVFAVLVHGFSYYFSDKIFALLWLMMCLPQGLAITFGQKATIEKHWPKAGILLSSFPLFQFLVFAACLILFKNFKFVELQHTVGFLPVLGWNIYLGFRGYKPGRWIGWGIAVSSLAAVVHTLKFHISDWFTYNDAAHLFIAVTLLLVCHGVLLEEKNTPATA